VIGSVAWLCLELEAPMGREQLRKDTKALPSLREMGNWIALDKV
jgi:hypothetical protein